MKKQTAAGGLTLIGMVFSLNVLGCGSDFLPVSTLSDLRVLGVITDPIEIGPREDLTLTPIVYLPEQQHLVEESWHFCPFTLGPSSGYACVVPSCDTELAIASDGTATLNPSSIAFECMARLQSSGKIPDSIPTELPEQLEIVIGYHVRSSEGVVRDLVVRIPLWTTGFPAERNRAPVIQRIDFGGQELTQGIAIQKANLGERRDLRVVLDESSLDEFVDAAGRKRTEEAIISFYASAGRFEFDRLSGTDVSQQWKAEQLDTDETQSQLYVVVRDLRGGIAVAGPFRIPLAQ